jgi:hypothetical protein
MRSVLSLSRWREAKPLEYILGLVLSPSRVTCADTCGSTWLTHGVGSASRAHWWCEVEHLLSATSGEAAPLTSSIETGCSGKLHGSGGVAMHSLYDAGSTRQGVGSCPGSCLVLTREILPLTSEMTEQLEMYAAAACSRSTRRIMLAVVAVVLVAILFSGDWDPVVMIMCCLFGVPGLLELIKGTQESFTADVETGTFVRLAGPIYLRSIGYDDGPNDYCLSLDGEEFVISLWTFIALRHVDWASVDYAACSRTLFAVRALTGIVLWQG